MSNAAGWDRAGEPSARVVEAQELHARVLLIEAVSEASMPLAEALEVLSDSSPSGAPAAVRRAVLMRRDLPVGALVEAMRHGDDDVRAFAVGMARAPLAAVVAACSDSSWRVRLEVARREDCPGDVLEALALDDDAFVRRAALAHAGMNPRLLVRVLTCGESRMDAEIAAHHPALDVPRERRALLSATSFGAVALLSRADLPVALVRRFAGQDQGAATRLQAVEHAKCPAPTLGVAATSDSDVAVRSAAAAREQCPAEALQSAASDPEQGVRRACAGNESCPPAAIDQLLLDQYEVVRVRAAKSAAASPLALADAARSDTVKTVRRAALANPRCPADVLASACADVDLVFDAAANTSCPPEGLFQALLTIRDLPREMLPRDCDDKAERRRREKVRAVITVARRRLPGRRWSWLAGQQLEGLHPEDLRSLLGRHLDDAVADPREVVRAAVAGHPETGSDVLAVLAGDASLLVRQVVTERILGAAGADRA